MIFMFGEDSPIRSLLDSSASRIHASLVLILLDAPLPQFFFIILRVHSRSHRCFQFLTSILDGFFQFLILRVNEIDPSQYSCVIQMELFIGPLLLLLQLPLFSRFLTINDLAWMSAVFSLISSRTTYIFLEVFLPIE